MPQLQYVLATCVDSELCVFIPCMVTNVFIWVHGALQVVVKFLRKSSVLIDCWVEDKEMGRVPLEINLLARLSHPNIVEVRREGGGEEGASGLSNVHVRVKEGGGGYIKEGSKRLSHVFNSVAIFVFCGRH